MISYKPFYNTLFQKSITEYELIFKHGISANTLYRMKKEEAITAKTLIRCALFSTATFRMSWNM